MSNNETKTPKNYSRKPRKNNNQVVIPCYEGKRLVEPDDIKNIEKFKDKRHGYRNPPRNTFFAGDTRSSFIVIPVKRKKCSWLFNNPLTDVSTEIIFRFFKKNINIVTHNNNFRIKYENYCEEFKNKYNDKVSYKDLALKKTIEELIIAALREKRHVITSYFKFSRKQKKEFCNTINRDSTFYRAIGSLVQYVNYMFYEIEFVKGTKIHNELFFAINLNALTSQSSDPTKKWSTRIDLFDDIRVVKQMPTEYFPYNSRIGIIDLTAKNPHVKAITLSKSTQILEIMKCKKEFYDKITDEYNESDKRCYAVCLKKLRVNS